MNHWSKHYETQLANSPLNNKVLRWFNVRVSSMYLYDLEKTLRPFVKKRRFLEIGCAPGNFMVLFNKEFEMDVYGVDRDLQGCRLTFKNLQAQSISNANNRIICEDVFRKSYRDFFKEDYDVVFSAGFIEHYHFLDTLNEIIHIHKTLCKPRGLIIITVPNINGLSKFWTSRELLKKHNLRTCNEQRLRKLFSDCKILYSGPVGGPLNIPPFESKQPTLNVIGLFIYGVARLVVDQPLKMLRWMGLNLNNKYTSPALMIVAKKGDRK